MKTKNLTPSYSLMMCFYWMSFSAILGFVSVYLLRCGFTSSQVGVIIAVSGSVSALAQPVVAAYADRPDSIGVKRLVLLVGGLIFLSGGAMLLFPGSMVLTALFYGLAMACLQLLMPLLNAWGIACVNCGEKLNIGLSRGISSGAYALASYGMGTLVAALGNNLIPVSIMLFYALFLLMALRFPQRRDSAGEASAKGAGLLEFFKRYPRYTGILVGCILIFISHVLLNSFTFQISVSKGGDSKEMGVAMALAALAELPTLMGFSWLLKKRGARTWFRISGVFFTLKALGTLLAGSIGAFYAVQGFQLLGWALISVSSIFYINELMAPEDAVKGQAYYTMAYTLGTVLGAIVGGWLIDSFGVPTMLALSTAAGALGAGVVLYFTGKKM